MGIEVDSLEIPLKTHSQTAIKSIDTLIDRLGVLNTSLTKVNGSGLTGVANGVNKLSNAMQGMKSVGTADFTRLATNITKIASLDSKNINRAASVIGQISKSLGSLKSVSISKTSKQVEELASGISKLGYKSSTKAIENIPKLATAMKDLMSSLSKAPRVSQNLIDMTNALAKLARTGASSGKAATSLSRSLDTYTKSTSKASSGTKGLASALGKMYASYWLLFRAFQKIGQSITLASDLVEVQNVVNTVFGDMTAKVEQYADRSIEQFGMSELAFKQYASRFQAMGSAMGIDSGLIGQANSFLNKSTNGYVALSDSMADVSLTLTQLTADMASFYNVEQSAVAEDLAAIFTGETRPLRTYGLDLTQATLSEWAMKQGLDANIQSMSQAEKTMLRYQYVLANTTAAQGDFARTANTWANQVRILQEQIKKWASVIGTGVIAAFKPFLQTLNTVMARVIDFTENVLNALGNIFGWKFEISGGGITDDLADSMGDTAIDTGDAAGSAGDLSDNLGDAAKNAKKLYSTVLGIDELNINNPNTGSSGSGSGGSGGTGGSGSGGAGAGTGTGLTTTMTRNDAILKAYESSIDSLYELGEYIGDTLTKTLNSINWDKVYQGARNFGKGLADFLNGLISPELFGSVGRTIAGALNTAIYAALSFGETFDFYDFGVSIATGINEFFRTFDFGALAQTLNVWVEGLIDTIAGFIKTISWSDILNAAGDFLGTLELDTVGVIIGAFTLKNSISTLSGMFSSLLSNFLAFNNISIGKISIGLSFAAATFVLADSEDKLANIIGAPITAFLSTYTFTGDLKISLAVSAFLSLAEIDINVKQKMWKKIFESLFKLAGDEESAQRAAELPELSLTQTVKVFFNMISDPKGRESLLNAPKDILDTVAKAFDNLLKPVTKNIGKFVSDTQKKIGKIPEFFKELPEKIGYYLGLLVGNFIKLPGQIGSAIESFVTETLPNWVANIGNFFTQTIPQIISNVVGFFAQLPRNIYIAISTFVTEILPQWGENVLEFFSGLLDGVIGFIQSIPENISKFFGEASETIGENGRGFLSGFVKGISDSLNIDVAGAISRFGERASDLFGSIWSGIQTIFSPMGSWFGDRFEDVKNAFLNAPEFFKEKFQGAYDKAIGAFQSIATWFHEKWDAVKGVFKDVQSFFKEGFRKAYDAVKNIWGGLGSFFNGVAENAFKPIKSLVNGVIKGINWVLEKVGSGTRVSEWGGIKFAKGSDGIPHNTLGVVNDQPGSTYKELIVPPSGKPFIPEGRNVMLPLEKGTKIMPAKQTKAFMSGMPHFAGGIGDFFGNAWDAIKNFTGDVFDYLTHPEDIVKIAIDKFVGISDFVDPWLSIAGGMVNKTFDSIVDFVTGIFDTVVPKVNYSPSAGVEQWRQLAAYALKLTNQYSDANLNLLLYQMQTESGGNPNAINNWDINAKNGTPSKGLMQVIDPTFKAYAYPGYDKNIYDPLSNMLAAIRYTLSRYGSLANGWKGHGYASGIGKINLSDLIPAYEVGGFPEDGLFFANHNELIGQFSNGKTAVAPNPDIQKGIEEAAYRGFVRASAENTRETSLLEELIDAVREGKQIVVDGRELVSAYDRRKNRNGFSFT